MAKTVDVVRTGGCQLRTATPFDADTSQQVSTLLPCGAPPIACRLPSNCSGIDYDVKLWEPTGACAKLNPFASRIVADNQEQASEMR